MVKLVITDMPWLLQVLAIAATFVMVAGAVSAFVGIALAIFRGRIIVDPPEDAKLPVLERAYRRNARAGMILTGERFRMERRLIGFGALGLVVSFALMGALTLLFAR